MTVRKFSGVNKLISSQYHIRNDADMDIFKKSFDRVGKMEAKASPSLALTPMRAFQDEEM